MVLFLKFKNIKAEFAVSACERGGASIANTVITLSTIQSGRSLLWAPVKEKRRQNHQYCYNFKYNPVREKFAVSACEREAVPASPILL